MKPCPFPECANAIAEDKRACRRCTNRVRQGIRNEALPAKEHRVVGLDSAGARLELEERAHREWYQRQ